MIEFEVLGKPMGKQRPRVTRFGTYTPPKTVKYEKLVKDTYNDKYSKLEPITCEIKASITAIFEVPKSYTKKQHIKLLNKPYNHKPDCDNIAKIVLDSLNGLAYTDDALVTELNVKKLYGTQEKVIVQLERV